MKHSVPKGDKKKKKEVTLEITKLEEELNDRHKKELELLENESTVSGIFSLDHHHHHHHHHQYHHLALLVRML